MANKISTVNFLIRSQITTKPFREQMSVLDMGIEKVIFQSDDGKSFNQEQAIDLLVSLVATDANSEKKWRGFYNSLSSTELQDEWDEYWES